MVRALTADIEGVVEGVGGGGLLIRRAVAVGVALEGAQTLIALNLAEKRQNNQSASRE
jgi:hypothetical protein